MLKANFHTHTVFCDGTGTARDVVEAAISAGFTSIGFSGHIDISPEMDIPAYLREIRSLQEEYADRIDILCGGEVDVLYPDIPALTGLLDYRIGSVHHLKAGDGRVMHADYSEEKFLRLLNKGFRGDIYRMTAAYFESVATVFEKTGCTFAGHFDLVTKYNNHLHLIDEEDPRYLGPAFEAMDHLVGQDVPFEINTRMCATGRIYPSRQLLTHLHERGGEILISSDAHHPAELARGFREACEYARSCGFDHTNYLEMREGRPVLVPAALT